MQLNGRDISEIPDSIKKLFEKMEESGLNPVFGLRQQGHFGTVERMRAEGKTWGEIGQAIGWDGDSVNRFYELEKPPEGKEI